MRNEVGWSAAESPVLYTYSATIPGQMAAPATAITGDTEVLISWTAPDAGGLTVTSYAVDIRGVDGTYALETTYCAVSTTQCSLPLLYLQASPYNLELGDLVQAVVRATNLIGESPDSSHNTAGALIETVPSAPPVAPQRNAATTLSSLSVDYYALTGTSRGGTPVLSYELQWDQGASVGVWQELVGFSSDSLLNQFTVEDVSDPTYITSGEWYSFRYRAKNRQGWGAFSTTGSIIAANVPDQLSPIATSMNGASVKIAWTTADQGAYSDGGQPTTEYEVLILSSDGSTFSSAPAYCAPSEATLLNQFCEIPMSALTSSSGPFALALGTLIQAKVAPRNSIGLGPYSSLNTAGVLAQTAPLKPATPVRDAASDQSTIVVDYPFDSANDGGSTILSLNLQWDAASGGVTWTTLIGESPYSTTESYTVALA